MFFIDNREVSVEEFLDRIEIVDEDDFEDDDCCGDCRECMIEELVDEVCYLNACSEDTEEFREMLYFMFDDLFDNDEEDDF